MSVVVTGLSTRVVAPPAAPHTRGDHFCQLALAAAQAAFYDAKFELDGRKRERTAVVLGTAWGCHASNAAHFDCFRSGGIEAVRPRLFIYTLPSAAAGEIAIQFGLRGPVLTIAGSLCAGIDALDEARRLLERGAADAALVVVVDEKTALCDSEERSLALMLEQRDGGQPFRCRRAFVAGDPQRALERLGKTAVSSKLARSAAEPLWPLHTALDGGRAAELSASDPSGAAALLTFAVG